MFALRTLREIKLLKYFQDSGASENIISILDVVRPVSLENFKEVYLVQELMETDVSQALASPPSFPLSSLTSSDAKECLYMVI